MKRIIVTSIFFLSVFISFSQENCGNSIDDDGDGLIDCYDSDCKSGVVPLGSYFNTATNGNGGTLPIGTFDSNWQVSTTSINGPYSPAVVMCYIPNVYYSSPWPDCAWITHDSFGLHSGAADFFYKIEFMLPCFTPCGKPYSDSAEFCLYMDFFSDNSVDEIYVNGIPQSSFISGVPASAPYTNLGYNANGMLSASLCRNWKAGKNELIVKVSSGYPFEAFLAQSSTTAPTVIGNPTILPGFNGNLSLCENANPITLTAASAGGTWSASCANCINATTGDFYPNIAGAGNHIITYSLTVPCPTSDTISINVLPKANAQIRPVSDRCIDAVPFNLSAQNSGGIWSGTGIVDPTTGLFDPAVAGIGTHIVSYLLSGPCPDSTSQSITITAPISADITGNSVICTNRNNIFYVAGNGTCLWSDGTTSSSITVTQPGMYWVTYTQDGCSIRDTVYATEDLDGGYIYVPNSFTPNNDGLNDVFNAKGVGITSYQILIFNRWGELCFESKSLTTGWDGKYKGENVANDLYVWKINYKTKCSGDEVISRIGHVSVVK